MTAITHTVTSKVPAKLVIKPEYGPDQAVTPTMLREMGYVSFDHVRACLSEFFAQIVTGDPSAALDDFPLAAALKYGATGFGHTPKPQNDANVMVSMLSEWDEDGVLMIDRLRAALTGTDGS